MQLFPASGPLAFGDLDIAGPFSKTVQSNQYIFVITDRYYELTRAVLTLKTTAMLVGNLFTDHWYTSYGILTYLLIDNGT